MGSTVSNTVIQNPTDKLVTIPVMDFMKSKSFISCHKSVRANANGYPYVTFINDKNVLDLKLFFEKLCLKARFDVNTHCCIFGFDHQYFVFYVRSTIEKIIGCT